MALYVVCRANPYFKHGYAEDIGEGMVQQVTMEMDNGRYKPYKNYGVAVPLDTVRDFLLRIQKHGIDERGLRG